MAPHTSGACWTRLKAPDVRSWSSQYSLLSSSHLAQNQSVGYIGYSAAFIRGSPKNDPFAQQRLVNHHSGLSARSSLQANRSGQGRADHDPVSSGQPLSGPSLQMSNKGEAPMTRTKVSSMELIDAPTAQEASVLTRRQTDWDVTKDQLIYYRSFYVLFVGHVEQASDPGVAASLINCSTCLNIRRSMGLLSRYIYR
jgi:hypothetical protein